MFGSDVSLLARISDRQPEGSLAGCDLSRVSPALRPLAERLIVAGHLERRAIWAEFLARAFERPPIPRAAPEPEPAADAAIEPMEGQSPPESPVAGTARATSGAGRIGARRQDDASP